MQERDLREIAQNTPPVERPEWLVAPDAVASPVSLRPRDPGDVRWYLPSWGERFAMMGWRNLLWLPAILMLFATVALSMRPYLLLQLVAYWKIWIVAVAVPVVVGMDQARKALRLRKDPFCIHCGYSLQGLPGQTHPCPECGEASDPAQCIEYRRDPHWYIQRYKLAHTHRADHVAFEAGSIRDENPDRV